MNNNIFINNIVVGATAELRVSDGGDNDGEYGTGNVYDNNCFGAEVDLVIRWGSYNSAYGTAIDDYTTYDSWETEHGEAWTQIEADPLFTDSDSDDYSLLKGSPCKGTGDSSIGAPYNIVLMPSTQVDDWPDNVTTGDQDDY